jgi:uncharacterized protein (TIGR03435 family)
VKNTILAAIVCLVADVTAQTLTFEAVSIKQNATGRGSIVRRERNGGFTMVNVPVSQLIENAYFLVSEPVGLPEWTRTDRYDVIATSPLKRAAEPGERDTMLRALLAERFKFEARIEQREQPVFNLVLAHSRRAARPRFEAL